MPKLNLRHRARKHAEMAITLIWGHVFFFFPQLTLLPRYLQSAVSQTGNLGDPEVKEMHVASVWSSSCKTAKRPRPDQTKTNQDQKISRPIKTKDCSPVFGPLTFLKMKDRPKSSLSSLNWSFSLTSSIFIYMFWIIHIKVFWKSDCDFVKMLKQTYASIMAPENSEIPPWLSLLEQLPMAFHWGSTNQCCT